MTPVRTDKTACWTAACGIALLLSGCSDPRFKQEQDRRDARMARHLNNYAAHDAAGAHRLQQMADLDQRLSRQRAEHLTYTCGLVRAYHERDVRRWTEEEPLRTSRLKDVFDGKPDKIDDTYAKMMY